MAHPTREDLVKMLDGLVRDERLGITIGPTPSVFEDVLKGYIDLLDKFDRVTSCR